MFTRSYRITVVGLLLLWSIVGHADLARGGGAPDLRRGAKDLGGQVESPAAWLVSIFRDYVSAVDGDRCPSAPTCSSFSVQAFKKHGFIMGWLMTVDRLIHEGKEETAVSPFVYIDGRLRIYDPVENNDFWWQKPYKDLQN
jgi:hypothetical protein